MGSSAAKTLTSAKDVIEFAKQSGVKIVDFKFVDLPGTWQHFSAAIEELSEEVFSEGVGFDGSSIRGFQAIHESDMLLMPDPTTAIVDPVCSVPTLSVICNVADPLTHEPYSRDPRYVALKAEAYLKSTGIADASYWGPEAEFFIFDNVAFEQNQYSAFYAIDSDEGIWNSGARGDKPNLGHRPRWKEGYFPVAPADQLQDFRSEVVLKLREAGVPVEVHHHEVATAGQCEIDIRFGTLVNMADNLMVYKYIIKNFARSYGKTATFMPKPIFGDNGSGMHVHMSIWKGGKPTFAGNEYAGLSENCLYFIGGVIKHAKAVNAFTNPLTNSYKRLVPGYEAPVLLAYSARNRSASCRIPFGSSPKSKRVEVRFPDPGANPYLGFAALLMAGLDGIKNKIHPGQPMDKDLYDLPPKELKKIPTVCGSLREALQSLDKDRGFLKAGGVFDDDQIDSYIELKMTEVIKFEHTPHPVEYEMYYSA